MDEEKIDYAKDGEGDLWAFVEGEDLFSFKIRRAKPLEISKLKNAIFRVRAFWVGSAEGPGSVRLMETSNDL